jgi:hypothetical protein
MNRFVAGVVVVVLFGFAAAVRADDKPTAEDKSKPDDTSKLVGNWKMTLHIGERAIESTLELKMDSDKLIGTLTGGNGREQKLDEVTFKNGDISFTITREAGGQKRAIKFSGKATGDTMKGKTEGRTERGEWEAKRAKEGT